MGQCITPALHTFSLPHTSRIWRNSGLRIEENVNLEKYKITHFQMQCILSIALAHHISHLRFCLNLSKLYKKMLESVHLGIYLLWPEVTLCMNLQTLIQFNAPKLWKFGVNISILAWKRSTQIIKEVILALQLCLAHETTITFRVHSLYKIQVACNHECWSKAATSSLVTVLCFEFPNTHWLSYDLRIDAHTINHLPSKYNLFLFYQKAWQWKALLFFWTTPKVSVVCRWD